MTIDKKKLFRETEARLHNYKYLEIQINSLELDIEREKNDYRGCGAISYDERSGVTYNINRSVENEVITIRQFLKYLTLSGEPAFIPIIPKTAIFPLING